MVRRSPSVPLRGDLLVVAGSALVVAATWAGVYGSWEMGAAFMLPGSLAGAFAVPLALSTLRRNRRIAAAAYAAVAACYPVLSYWDRFPYMLGQLPPVGQLQAMDALAGMPCAVFGVLLLRIPRPADGIPGPGLLLDALQAFVAAVVVGILASAAMRGGQLGVGYFAASFALIAGVTKAALVKGVVGAVAALVLLRGVPGPRRVAAALAFVLFAALPAWDAGAASTATWCAGFGLTVLAHLSRKVRPGKRVPARPLPLGA